MKMEKGIRDSYRQGDVLLVKVNKIPKEAKPRKSNIVVEGEASGHAHRIVNGTILETKNIFNTVNDLVEKKIIPESLGKKLQNEPSLMWIKASVGAKLVHEEHGIIEIEVAFYIVSRQREGSEEDQRSVLD